jgi:hypothetical protein
MKKITTILTLLIFSSVFSQIPSYVPTNGLIGYWPFNGNANDVSGGGNNGTVNGAILTTDRFGNTNNSYDFDFNGLNWNAGLHKEIYIPFNSSFNSPSLTVSLWAFPRNYFFNGIPGTDKVSALLRRYQYGYSNPNGQTWTVDLSNNTITCSIISASTNITQNGISVSSNILLNQWSQILFSYDNLFLKLYINGILVSQTPSSIQINIFGNSGVSIGDSNQANGYWYESNAKLDDIGIWNRALTQAEITGLYSTLGTSQNMANNTVTIYPNPANDHITIDCGNLANVTGYQIKIVNTLGQEVFSGAMNTQQYVVPLNTWSGNGVYFVKIYDASNNLLNTKKIILQ